jgi:uncharacterized membrane protein YhaH (DUF805 family)
MNLNYITMFKNAFSFNGRIKRTEYGISFIIYIVLYIFIRIMVEGVNGMPAFGLLYIPMIWFLWAQSAKRCHDLNKSGWWQLIPFYFFVLLFSEGDQWPNQYDIPGTEVFYGADDYEKPFDINEPAQSAVISAPANDIVPPATNE